MKSSKRSDSSASFDVNRPSSIPDNPCPLVFIEWVDSAQPTSNWAFLSGFEDLDTVRCVSVGWLIHDGDDTKAVAANVGSIHNDNNVQVSGVIRIPARCVVRMLPLEEPALT